MKVVTTVADIQSRIADFKKKSFSIGFVPTMGALHEGHIKLIRRSKKENDITVCSIFVNPTQFNDKKDLEKYPRTLEADCQMLEAAGTDLVFAPGEEDIYPKNLNITIPDLNGLDSLWEGAYRPGHFRGVVQVVQRLLDIVLPHRLYMGQKDFQQFTIIQHVINVTNRRVHLVVCKTIREKNGLAKSSRNQRLSSEMKQKAGLIYRTLSAVKKKWGVETPETLLSYASKRLSTEFFTLDYVVIIDGTTLQPISSYKKNQYAVICVALWAEGVRLIDNVILEEPGKNRM